MRRVEIDYNNEGLNRRYYDVAAKKDGFALIEGSCPSEYSSRYEVSECNYRWIFVALLLFATYVVVFGLR